MKWILLMILFLGACGDSATKRKFEPEPQLDMGIDDASTTDVAQQDGAFDDASFDDTSFADTTLEDMSQGTPCGVL